MSHFQKWHEWTPMCVSCHFQNSRIMYIVEVKRRKTIDAGIIDDVKKNRLLKAEPICWDDEIEEAIGLHAR